MQPLLRTAGPLVWLLFATLVTAQDVTAQEAAPAASSPATIAAAPSPQASGTLIFGRRAFAFKYAVAYETKDGDETAIMVLASDRRIAIDPIKAALKEGDGTDRTLSLSQPYVRLKLKPTGEVVRCDGASDGTSFSRGNLTGDLKVDAGRIQGKVVLPTEEKSKFASSGFNLQLNVAIGLDVVQPVAAKPAGPVKPFVAGVFKGNGKLAKLGFVSARPGDPFSDKPTIELIFSERDHSRAQNPSMKAGFGDFGSALILRLYEDGKIIGCEVAHAAHTKGTFSSIGSVYTSSFDVSEGRIDGAVKTEEPEETFGQTWEVDLKFSVPFAAPKPKQPIVTKPATPNSPKPVASVPAANVPAVPNVPGVPVPVNPVVPAAPAVPALSVYDLALPKNATNKEYKTLVEMFDFKSVTAPQALIADWSKLMAAQGWKSDGHDLVNAKSSILHRTRGTAKLTIFVKADGTGSKVNLHTQGLDWAEKPAP